MTGLIEFLLLIGIVWWLLFHRTKTIVWTGVMAAVLLVYSFFSSVTWFILLPAWIIYLVSAVLFNIADVRRPFFTKGILAYFKRVLPPISRTEQEALDAGDVWWEKDLFQGNPDWKKFSEYKKPTLSQEEQSFVDNQVNTLCRMLDDWQIVQDRRIPEAAWDYMRKEGFFGLCIEKKYGGHAFSAYAHSTIVGKISSRSLSAAVSMMVPNSLGPAELVYHYGTDEQKDYYLPRLASGEEIPCFGLTGPSAGSDAGSIPDKGVVCKGMYKGSEVLGIRLTWDKRYITLAPIATVIGLAFKLYDPDKLVGDKEDIGITLCLIPADYPGVEVGLRHFPAGMAFMNGPTRGKDVFIPMEFIIGGQDRLGEGWKMLMACLSIGRSISLPAISSAAARLGYAMTGAYARIRKQFKIPIAKFEGVEEALANIAGKTYIIEATRAMTASVVDLGLKPSIASALTKYHTTELGRDVLNYVMDVHAGKAVQHGPSNYMCHAHQSIPVSITVEGANILTRNLIIFGQGVMRCHPYIEAEIQAAHGGEGKDALKAFDKVLYSHIGYALSNLAKALWYGITGGRFINVPIEQKLLPYYRQLTRMSTALAFATDISLLLLGGDIKRKESLSARLGDILSYLYLGSAVLRRCREQGETETDLDSAEWAMQYILQQTQKAIDDLTHNFPIKGVGRCMRLVIFPYGQSYRTGPSDELSHKLVRAMIKQTDFRKEFTKDIFIGEGVDDPTGRVEYAFNAVLAAKDAEKKFYSAVSEDLISSASDFEEQLNIAAKEGILTKEEIELLRKADEAVRKAVAVDDFTDEELAGKQEECLEKVRAV